MVHGTRLVILAGQGSIPPLVAAEALRRDVETLYLPVAPDAILPPCEMHITSYIPATRLGAILRQVKEFGATEAVMIGKVPKQSLLLSRLTDYDFKTFWALRRLVNANDLSIFRLLHEEFEKIGVTIVAQTKYLETLLEYSGLLTKRCPTRAERNDVDFGLRYAREIARLDIGQTVVVKKKAIIAVEAIEGTDQTIRRAKDFLNGKGGVVCKVERPLQDLRFDIPTVGLQTLIQMKYAGCSVLAIEEKKTFLVDAKRVIQFANDNQISILATRVPTLAEANF